MRHYLVLLFVVLLPAALACHGQVIPRSAQAGSRIAIPIGGTYRIDIPPETIGYGGDLYTDHQRGELVFRLGGPNGFELDTQVTVSLMAHPNSVEAFAGIPVIGNDPPSGVQHFSVVDIPENAPTGNHELYVTREVVRNGQVEEVASPDYGGTLTILPSTISEGMPEPAEAKKTELAWWNCSNSSCEWDTQMLGSGVPLSDNVPLLVPRPEVRVRFNQPLWAAEVELSYPAAVIDVKGATEPISISGGRTNQRASVWMKDDDVAETVRIAAAAQGRAFRRLSLVFTLDDGTAEVLDPSQLEVVELRAYDETGTLTSASISNLSIR